MNYRKQQSPLRYGFSSITTADPADVFQVVFSEVTACSTCQLVYDIAIALGWEQLIDEGTATCLYARDHDRQWLLPIQQHHRPYASGGRIPAGEGRPARSVHEDVMDDNPEHRLRLLGFTLSERLSVHEHLATAVIQLSAEDLARHDFHPGDTEGFVNYGLSMRGCASRRVLHAAW